MPIKKLTPEKILKNYKEEVRLLESHSQKKFLNCEAYDYIFAMIELVEKKSDLHLILLHLENIINEEGKRLSEKVINQRHKLTIFYEKNKKIIDKMINERGDKK